jgi:hypothetical protein
MGKQINIDHTDGSSSKAKDQTFPSARQEGTWGNGGIVPLILKLRTKWMWIVSFTTQPLYPRGKSLDTHRILGWVGSRAGLDALVKWEISFLPRNWITVPRSSQPNYCTISYGMCVQKFGQETWRQKSTRLSHSAWEQHYNECQNM